MGQASKALVGLILLGYPIAIYLARDHFSPGQMLAGLLALLGVRALVAGWMTSGRAGRHWLLGMLLLVAAVVVGVAGTGLRMQWLRFYPMVFDLGVASVFIGSLFTRQPLVERISRAFHREPLAPQVVRYTRHVTEAWGALMILIALISLYTALASPLRMWSLFNGVIVYVILVVTFVSEYAIRRHLRRKWKTA